MNKYLCAVIAGLFTILMGIGGWWVSRAEAHFTIVDQLQFRSLYLNGQLSAAPVATPTGSPAAAK